MNGFKEFSKLSFKSALWFCFYLLAQTFSGIILFLININMDNAFLNRFLELFAPIFGGNNYSYSIERNLQVLNSFNELMDNFFSEMLVLSGLIIICFTLILFRRKRNKDELNDTSANFSLKQMVLLIVGGVALNIVISAIIYILPEGLTSGYGESITNITTSELWILNLISAGFITPIVEEIIFRYGIMGCFIKINPRLAICYQAILFATVHGSPVQMIYTFFIGITFGYLTYRTKSLLPAMLLHISLNSSTIIVSNTFKHYEFFGLFYCIFVILISVYIATCFTRKEKNKGEADNIGK